MHQSKRKPVSHPHSKSTTKLSAAQPPPCWHIMTGVQLSLYDIQTIRTIRIGGGGKQ